jgi:hypothetical protein
MSDLEAAFLRHVDLSLEKRQIELELRLMQIDRELEEVSPERWCSRPLFCEAA